jgi:molybdopterin-guanine dinucleotide biosynthesis protein A
MGDAEGFVTAGGSSSRMGRDKAWLDIGGRPMIERVIAALASVTSRVSVIANSARYERLGLPVYRDSNESVGPLEAIRTALANSRERRVILVGCDMPFITPALLEYLIEASGDNQAVVPASADRKLEPLCALYSTDALAAVSELIRSGRRKTSLLFDLVPTRIICFEEISHLEDADIFFENVNTPEEYARAKSYRPKTGSGGPS